MFKHACTGEGNGNPLQCSCLENPGDRGAWWAAVYGVEKSRTQLKWLSSVCSSRNFGDILTFAKFIMTFSCWLSVWPRPFFPALSLLKCLPTTFSQLCYLYSKPAPFFCIAAYALFPFSRMFFPFFFFFHLKSFVTFKVNFKRFFIKLVKEEQLGNQTLKSFMSCQGPMTTPLLISEGYFHGIHSKKNVTGSWFPNKD